VVSIEPAGSVALRVSYVARQEDATGLGTAPAHMGQPEFDRALRSARSMSPACAPCHPGDVNAPLPLGRPARSPEQMDRAAP